MRFHSLTDRSGKYTRCVRCTPDDQSQSMICTIWRGWRLKIVPTVSGLAVAIAIVILASAQAFAAADTFVGAVAGVPARTRQPGVSDIQNISKSISPLNGSTPHASMSANNTPAIVPANSWNLVKGFPAAANGVDNVSCTPTGNCAALATNNQGNAVALYSLNGGASWHEGTFPAAPAGWLNPYFLSCGSASDCAAVRTNALALAKLTYFGALFATEYGSSPSAAFYSTNGGQSWMQSTLPNGTTALTDISCGSANDCTATGFVNGKNAILYSLNGGASWNLASIPNISTLDLLRVSCEAPLSGSATTQTSVTCLSAGSPLDNVIPTFLSKAPALAQFLHLNDTTSPLLLSTQLPVTLISTDGGATWKQGPSLPGGIGIVTSISCTSGMLDCTMTGSGFDMYSSTGGASWTGSRLPGNAGLPTSISCYSPGICITATASGNGYQSTNGGASWIQTTLEPTQNNTAAGSNSAFAGWENVSCASSSSCAISLVALPGDGQELQGIYYTTNENTVWQESRLPMVVHRFIAVSCQPVGVCVAASNTQIAYSSDSGTTWTAANLPEDISQFNDISCGSATDCIAVGTLSVCTNPSSTECLLANAGDADGIAPVALYSNNAGQSWINVPLPLGINFPQTVYCSSRAICVIESDTRILYSSDGGLTWEDGTLPSENGASLLLSGSLSCSSDSCITAGVVNGRLAAFYSTDGGAGWNMASIPGSAPEIAPMNLPFTYGSAPSDVKVQGIGYVSCSANGTCTLLGGPAGTLTSSGNIINAYDYAYNSTDGGESWTQASIAPDPALQGAFMQILGITCTGNYCIAPTYVTDSTNGFEPPLEYQSSSPLLVSSDGGVSWGISTANGLPANISLKAFDCISITDCLGAGKNNNGSSSYGGVVYQNLSPFAPTLISLSPNSAPIAGGTTITIEGAALTGTTGVNFGSIPAASFGVMSSSTLTATAPAVSQPGIVNLTVTTPLGTSKPVGFLYVTTGNRYVPLSPYRVADTRCSLAAFVKSMPAGYCSNIPAQNRTLSVSGSDAPINVQVGGTGSAGDSVPSDAQAVVVNITAVSGGYDSGVLIAYPTGTPMPIAYSLSFSSGSDNYYLRGNSISTSSLSTVALGNNKSIMIYPYYYIPALFRYYPPGASGRQPPLNIVVDVEGYYVPSGSTGTGAGFTPISPPARVLDTRCTPSEPDSIPLLPSYCSSEHLPVSNSGVPAAGAGQSIAVKIAGIDGIPATGVSAVSMTVTAANPGAGGYLTVWPDMSTGDSPPMASNVNFSKGQNRANEVISEVGANGYIRIYNSAATPVNVVVDVNGYYSSSGYSFTPSTPITICNTASTGLTVDAGVVSGVTGQCDGSGDYLAPKTSSDPATIQVTVLAGIPSNVSAIVAQITVNGNPNSGTAYQSQLNGYLTAWPGNTAMPTSSYLNWSDGSTVTGTVITGLDSLGSFDAYASSPADLTVNVTGWFQN